MTKLVTAQRLAATAAVTALGAGALVGVTTSTASAAVVNTVFSCTFPSAGVQDVPVTVTTPELPAEAGAGTEVPAIPAKFDATIPAAVVGAAKAGFGATAIGGRSDDMVGTLNDPMGAAVATSALTNVVFQEKPLPATPAPVVISTVELASTAPVPAATTAIELPGAGSYTLNLPNSFTFVAALATPSGTQSLNVPCTLKAGSSAKVADLAVVANEATIVAKTAKKVSKSGKAKLKVTVSSDGAVPSGKVKVMVGKKVVGKGQLNAKGKANVTLKKVKESGLTKVKVSYAGDDFTEDAKSKKVKVRIG